jgi:3-oxoacyl-[acyl-carrier-protein] synthase-1
MNVSLGNNSDDRRQVAITGLGIVSCIGLGLSEVASSLKSGRSGIVLDEERRAGFRSALTGRISGFSPRDYGLSLKALRTMGEPAQYAYAATRDAVVDAGLKPDDVSSPRCGLVFGNDSCVKSSVESIDILRSTGKAHFIGGSKAFQLMGSTVSMNLAASLNIKGANWTIGAACSSGAHALGQGAMLIRGGLQDIVLAGGAQELNLYSMASIDALGAMSIRHDDPAAASRPFDTDRDGLVPSGGAACLVLEELRHAQARGARVYGLLAGYGFSSDASGGLTQPSPTGAVMAMRMALADAHVNPDQIDYVNAHATSTVVGDRAEACAIAEVFDSRTPVSSTKSMTGHECWMSGASEAVYTTLMARDGFLAPNINFHGLDKDVPAIDVIRQARESALRLAVSNSFGFGGTNAAIVLDFRRQF